MFRQLIAGAAAAVIALTGVKSGQHNPEEFYRAEGGAIVSPANETAMLRGIEFGNESNSSAGKNPPYRIAMRYQRT